MPKHDSKKLEKEWLEWIASVWAIWYNHELAPLHSHVFTSALEQLLEWSGTPSRWERCPLGKIVSFYSLTTFREITNTWALWAGAVEGFRVKSVRAMKEERRSYQAFHFQKHFVGKKLETTEMIERVSNWKWNSFERTDTPEMVEAVVQDSCDYLEGGTAHAEKVLGLQSPSSGQTVVNKTFYQQADGSYSLLYDLDPYAAYRNFLLYSPTEVCQIMRDDQISIQALPVSDEHFRTTPLLSNSVQLFGMWITTTANILKQSDKCRVSFTFDCSEAVGFCQTLFQFPDQYWEGLGILKLPKFDAIFSSNVIDSLMPGSVLVVTAARLLKLNAALFTTTFSYSSKTQEKTMFAFIKALFGLIPELLPVVLGIRCIGYDGNYSSTTKIQPTPIVNYGTEDVFEPVGVTLIWKNITSHPLIVQSLTNEPYFTEYLLIICKDMVCYWCSFDAFLAIADCFIANFNTDTPSYQFWEPFCKKIVEDPSSKKYLIQMQTQSFLHGFHMHITVTEKSCPLCSGQELEDYIGAYSISFHVSAIDKYEEPSFLMHLYFTQYDFAIITSLVGSTVDSNVQLNFFFPKEEFSRCKKYELFKNISPFTIQRGEIQNLSSSSQKYQFLKNQTLTSCLPIQSSMGKITRHVGNGSQFETTLSLTEEFLQVLELSKFEVGIVESGERKLELSCGKEIHMTIVYPYPIQNNVSIKLLKERKMITILVERAPHPFYSDEPTLYFELHNPLTLPKLLCNDSQIIEEFRQQLALTAVDTSDILCSKDIFEYLATHVSNKYFIIEFCNKHSMSIENMTIVVHSFHMNPDFETTMMSLSYCFPQSFDNLIKSNIMSSWLKLTNGAWTQISVDECQINCIKRTFLYFKNSTRKYLNSEIPFPTASHALQQYFHHTLIHPLYPNTQLDSVKSAVERFLSSDTEKRGKKFNTFLSVESVQHEEEIVSTSTELQSQSHEECANCKKAQPNLKNRCGCGRVQYCGKECKAKHRKEHKLVCQLSSTNTSTHISEKSTSTASVKSKHVSNEPAVESTFSQEQKTLDSQGHETLDSQEHKTLDSQVQETLDSQEQETLGSQEQETLVSQDQETLDSQEQETIDFQEQETLDSQEQETMDFQEQETLDSKKQETLDSEKDKETATSSALLSAPTGKTQDEKQICSRRKKTSTTLHRCSCHKVSYCTVECQRLDWPKHKDVCKSTSLTV